MLLEAFDASVLTAAVCGRMAKKLAATALCWLIGFVEALPFNLVIIDDAVVVDQVIELD